MTRGKADTEFEPHSGVSRPASKTEASAFEEPALDWGTVAKLPILNIGVRYVPMWDTRRQVISTFVAQPYLRNSGRVVAGRRQIQAVDGSITDLALDPAMLAKAGDDLYLLLQGGMRSLVCLELHYETLASAAARADYLERIRALSPDMRKHLILALVGLPQGVPAVRLFDITAGLRQSCRSVIARTDLRDPMFGCLRDAGITVAGVEVVERPADETLLIQRLTAFSTAAHKAGLASFLHGVPSLSIAAAAVGAGFTYISGASVASPADGLRMVARYGLQDLYSRMLLGDDGAPPP
jgi:hypothetical protein